MSQAGSLLILIVLLLGLAVYWLVFPPVGFDESIGHRLTVPVILVCCALMIFDNIRMKAHIAQLVGALRGLAGRAGRPPDPAARREAVQILLKSLRSDKANVRNTAAEQLKQLTGQDLGADATEWEAWWAANEQSFR